MTSTDPTSAASPQRQRGERVRVATIGTSSITETFIEAAHDSDAVEVVVCYSRDRDRAAAFAARNGVPQGTDDWDHALELVDAVYVASPNSLHADQIRRCLTADRHVLAEKPLTGSAIRSEALFELAAERGLVLLEAMRSAFDPGMTDIRRLLPTLGAVRLAHFSYCQRSSRYDQVLAGERVNIFDPAFEGGALADLGVYCAHPLVDLFGEPTWVQAAAVHLPSGTDGAGSILAGYPGFVATLTFSKISASSAPNEIAGELGTLTVDHIALPRSITVDYLDGRRVVVSVDAPTNNLGYEIERFADLIVTGTQPSAETWRSLAAAQLIDRARESFST